MLTEKNKHQNWIKAKLVGFLTLYPLGYQQFKVRSREKNASQQQLPRRGDFFLLGKLT